MKNIGDEIAFASRRGHVIGYWTGKRHGHAQRVSTFYVVHLDRDSDGYLAVDSDEAIHRRDCFVTVMLVAVESV